MSESQKITRNQRRELIKQELDFQKQSKYLPIASITNLVRVREIARYGMSRALFGRFVKHVR